VVLLLVRGGPAGAPTWSLPGALLGLVALFLWMALLPGPASLGMTGAALTAGSLALIWKGGTSTAIGPGFQLIVYGIILLVNAWQLRVLGQGLDLQAALRQVRAMTKEADGLDGALDPRVVLFTFSRPRPFRQSGRAVWLGTAWLVRLGQGSQACRLYLPGDFDLQPQGERVRILARGNPEHPKSRLNLALSGTVTPQHLERFLAIRNEPALPSPALPGMPPSLDRSSPDWTFPAALAGGLLLGWVWGGSFAPMASAVTARSSRKPAAPVLDLHPIAEEAPASAALPLAKALKALDFTEDPKAAASFDVILQSRLRRGAFAELDAYADAARRTRARLPGGAWVLARMVSALASHPGGEDRPDPEWAEHLARFQAWAAARPGSMTAREAWAFALTDYAWKARGSGYANTVTAEGWARFKDRLAQARQVLGEAPAIPCPMWFRTMQKVALGQGWDRGPYERLFARAVAVEPRFQECYVAKAWYLMPRWYGKEGEWEAFASQATQALGPEGDAVYFFIMAAQAPYYEHPKFFTMPGHSWPRTRAGFAFIETHWGADQRLLNRELLLAGQACDRAEAARVAGRIKGPVPTDIWGSQGAYENYRDWAFGLGKYRVR
jgi:hypothetical protein